MIEIGITVILSISIHRNNSQKPQYKSFNHVLINKKNIFITPSSVIPAHQQMHLRKVPFNIKLLVRIIKGTHDVSSPDMTDFVLYRDWMIQKSVAIKC